MISDYFCMPANQKADEEKRIEYTRERISEVKDFLSSLLPYDLRSESSIHAMHDCNVDYEMVLGGEWAVFAHYGTDGKVQVVFNRNHWQRSVDVFQQEHRCKIAEIDYLYLLMQVLRSDRGIDVRPCDGSLSIGLWHRGQQDDAPDYQFVSTEASYRSLTYAQ